MKQKPLRDPYESKLHLAEEQLQAGRVTDAERTYREILRDNNTHAAANSGLGLLLHRAGADEAAIEHLKTAVTAWPNHLETRFFLAVSLSNLMRLEESANQYKKLARIHPNVAEVHNNLGIVNSRLHRDHDVEQHFLRALKLQPSLAETHKNLGMLYREQGRMDEAREYFKQALAIQPHFPQAQMLLANITRFTEYDDQIRALESSYQRDDIADNERLMLAYALGKASHHLRQYPQAFQYWCEANTILRRTTLSDYSVKPALAEMREVKRVFSADFCAGTDHTPPTITTPALIFIVGMPRSGTTLTEQIIASHSTVYGAGELYTLDAAIRSIVKHFPADFKKLQAADWQTIRERYLQDVATRANGIACVTDKMPANFVHIGAIRKLFPDAKIIHCRRNALDTDLSCFRTYFAMHPLGFTCDLTDLGRYHRQYLDLMAHWDRVQTVNLYHIDYESLVTDTETQVRKLLEFCELPFEADCLAFYKTRRSITTASAAQVRQPIYRDSLEGWKHYEQQLQPLKTELEHRPGHLANFMSDITSRLRGSSR